MRGRRDRPDWLCGAHCSWETACNSRAVALHEGAHLIGMSSPGRAPSRRSALRTHRRKDGFFWLFTAGRLRFLHPWNRASGVPPKADTPLIERSDAAGRPPCIRTLVVTGPGIETQPRVSADDKWLAYPSSEKGHTPIENPELVVTRPREFRDRMAAK
jgi:hypothetical protein